MTRVLFRGPCNTLLLSVAVIFTADRGARAEEPTPPPAGLPAEAPSTAVEEPAKPEKRAGPVEVTEEILVTGSRIPRKDLSTPAPVTVFSRQQLIDSGRANVGEFLQLIPEQGNALNRQVNNEGNGSTRVSLRGLGDHRTLVLLNGRRYVAAGVGADRSVDLNTIPTAAVERIEILKDGASPIYGSDAMGGVVNIITRKRWSGVEAAARVGSSSRGDAQSYGASLSAGAAHESGSYLVSVSYESLGSAMAGDRWFTAKPYAFDYATGEIGTTGDLAVPEGSIAIPPPEIGVPNGNACWDALMVAFPSGRRFVRDPAAGATCGWRPMNTSAIAGEGGDLYNYQPENYLVTPLRTLSLFAIGDRMLGDASRLYFEASYVNRRSDQLLAPLPLFTAAEGITVSADNVYNPFGRDFTRMARRLVEVDNRRFAQDVDTFRIVGGLDGALPRGSGPFAGWAWDVSVNYGRTTAAQRIAGFLTLNGLAKALGPSFVDPGPDGVVQTQPHGVLQGDDVARCGTPASPIPDCVPVDLFNGPGSITPDQVNGLTYTGTTTGQNEMIAVQANATGSLVRLGSDRPVALATGYEYRSVHGQFVPDTMALRGDRRDVRAEPTSGTADVHELYAELGIPILSGMRFAEQLEVVAAARAFKHGRYDPAWTWKLGARWSPIRDLTFRGTASTAYRVPSIQELFQGETLNDNQLAADPCADLVYDPVFNPFMTPERAAWCQAAGVPAGGTGNFLPVPAPLVGNAKLRPETARVLTAGVVLEPRFAKGLSLTLDYWEIRVDSPIGQPFPGMILELCYPNRAGAMPQLCDLVDRDPATGLLRKVTDRILNGSGSEFASGVDMAARWRSPTPLGQFGISLDVVWLLAHDVDQMDGRVLHGKGTYDLFFQPNALMALNPEWKATLGITWSLRGLAAGANARFVSGFKECGSDDPSTGGTGPDACSFSLFGAPSLYSRRVDSWTALDAFVEYEFATRAGRTKLGAGVLNALDKAPPFVATSFLPYSDPGGYDLLGRSFYGRISHRL